MDDDRIKRTSAVDKAFENRTVLVDPDETLLNYLQTLGTGYVQNPMVQHREIIRAITINHILLQRFVDRLDAKNSKLSKYVIYLTVVATLAAVAQIAIALMK
jgi:hypothetical protein